MNSVKTQAMLCNTSTANDALHCHWECCYDDNNSKNVLLKIANHFFQIIV